MPLDPIAHVAELWRYPVKSMRGERVDRLQVTPRGIAHDRTHALLSSGAPIGKPRVTSRERASLLQYQAIVRGETPYVVGPHGSHSVDDPELLRLLEHDLPHGHSVKIESDPEAAPYTDVRPSTLR